MAMGAIVVDQTSIVAAGLSYYATLADGFSSKASSTYQIEHLGWVHRNPSQLLSTVLANKSPGIIVEDLPSAYGLWGESILYLR